MYVIIRVINGTTETLKNSNSHATKIFDNLSSAQLFVNRLNKNVIPSMQWTVLEKKNIKQLNKAE